MTGSPAPSCPHCGDDLVLEMDPASPPDALASVLLADPPFRYVCASSQCFSTQDGASTITPRTAQNAPLARGGP
ncbi:MAG: hypothetical protein M3130_03015 [Actinomycetota bacterium]|nr:hypothetical protein [Actinomycetota bacterium]